MTNEQREAIDTLKEITENDLLNYWEGTERPYNAIQIVLSLIKEQQEKIAKYEKIYKEYDCYRWVEELNKKDKQIQLMSEYMEENMDEHQLDEIYAKQYNCNGMERNWTRGKEKEVEDIKQFFEKLAKEKDI